MTLTIDQRLQVAQIAKELTLEYGGKIKYTDTATGAAMNDNLANNIDKLYSTFFNSIEAQVTKDY
ncbi:hypothetical protein ACQCVK_04190 [Rossellomorea vietnamensis]|uniref:hypothetical protein n=1 Tax=Rossellomorea vietnamensis TaxID=218284 RepID=UPI003CF7DFFC